MIKQPAGTKKIDLGSSYEYFHVIVLFGAKGPATLAVGSGLFLLWHLEVLT
jgi:hypothetical protein